MRMRRRSSSRTLSLVGSEARRVISSNWWGGRGSKSLKGW